MTEEQTVSKWETDETRPDIRQSKKMAVLYGLPLDELVELDIDIKEIQEVIDRTSEEASDKIDWMKAWIGKYPVLSRYREEVDTDRYGAELGKLLGDLEKRYGYNELDSFPALCMILLERRRISGKHREKVFRRDVCAADIM